MIEPVNEDSDQMFYLEELRLLDGGETERMIQRADDNELCTIQWRNAELTMRAASFREILARSRTPE